MNREMPEPTSDELLDDDPAYQEWAHQQDLEDQQHQDESALEGA
jgi:hypothetical protein